MLEVCVSGGFSLRDIACLCICVIDGSLAVLNCLESV